jgi:hypothetical protein
MVHTDATNLTTNSSENVSSRKKLHAKNARLNKKNDELVVKFVALVCTINIKFDELNRFEFLDRL